MASVGPRGRRISQIPSTVHVVGHQGETHGETKPFCSRLGDKSRLPILATFKAGLGNASDHISTRKTPDLNKNVSERQSPQPQPVANVRGGADMLFYRYEIHAAPAPEISQVAPAFPSVQTTHSHRGAFLKRECSQRAQTCSASSVTFSLL
jgi:hypothetical protein